MFLKDFFFPKFCLSCSKIGTYLCPKCQKKLEYFDYDRCLYCGRKSMFGFTHPGCSKENGVDGFLTVFKYNNTLKKIVKAFKYRHACAVWDEFILTIEPKRLEKISAWTQPEFIQPIPLNIKKLNNRGFNQAEIIADFFNRFLKLKKVDWLERKKETEPQAQMKTKKERRSNVKGVFVVKNKRKVKKARVVLVDDLLTTGNTIFEAARVLKKSGCDKVFVLTLARG